MPIPPSQYVPGPVSPQQLNTDLYGKPGIPSGVLFHAHRPLQSETILQGGTAYTELAAQPIRSAGVQAYTVVDTTALYSVGADNPGTASLFSFNNKVPATEGIGTRVGGWWLSWNFPVLEDVTVPPGGVGAGMALNGTFNRMGTFQYGATTTHNTPFYLDIIGSGGTANTWEPGFWWLSPSVPQVYGYLSDTSAQTTRMGWLYVATGPNAPVVDSIPQVPVSWGTVTSAGLNAMGSALALLNNPPALAVQTESGQSVPDDAITVLTFTTTVLDNYAGWSSAASTYTAPLPGLYLFSPTTAWGTASDAFIRRSALIVNADAGDVVWQGTDYPATPVGPGDSGVGLTGTSMIRVYSLGAGDTVQAAGLQNSGGDLSLYTGYPSRFVGAWMTPVAPSGTVLTWEAPETGYWFQAGALAGTAITAALETRIGNDVNFLLNRPYFTGYQTTSQSGFADNTWQHVTIDTVGAPPRGGNGDSYGGWNSSDNWYVSQVPGWYLVVADLYATKPAATTAVITAGIYCSSSGGITPSNTPPDWYQQCYFPYLSGRPGAAAVGLYYLQPGEYVYPMLQARYWGGTWGTFVAWAGTSSASPVVSQFSCFWVSELKRGRLDA